MSRELEVGLAHELTRGGRVLAIAALVVGGLAGFIPLAGAVIVPGLLVVQSSLKKVQHASGGVIAEVLVANGDRVEAGQPLVRFDETQARTGLQVVARQLDEVRVRLARLNGERDGTMAPVWPDRFNARLTDAESARLIASEAAFFRARRDARASQQALAESRIAQLEKSIGGLGAQLRSNTEQAAIASSERKGVEALLEQKLSTIPRATQLRREAARLTGEEGQLSAQVAEMQNKIAETRLQALQADQAFRSEVMKDLREAEDKEGELTERKLAAEDVVTRTLLRAPAAGRVHQLNVHTIGGVVGPGETLMTIVPELDALEVEARLPPDKIDQVHTGQPARIRLSAFNQRTTPELKGTVDLVSADLVREPQANTPFYEVRVSLAPAEVQRLGGLTLVPGMPAEVFLETGSRTMLSYFFKPITDQLGRMFRER